MGGGQPPDPERVAALEERVEQILTRLAALEAAAAAPTPFPVPTPVSTPTATAPATSFATGPAGQPDLEEGTVTYRGHVSIGGKHLVVRRQHQVAQLWAAEPEAAVKVLAALAHPARLALIRSLLDGPRNTQELRTVLDDPSAGQLYHHLNQLLGAGLVLQSERSRYTLGRGSAVALCALLAAAEDLAEPPGL